MATLQELGDWVDERTGWRARARVWLEHPAVGGGPWAAAIAASVGTCIAVLAVTGLILMTAYAPAPQSAWGSVHYVQFVQPGGWIVRGLHFWAAQSLFVLAAVHIVHGALIASYRKPGEIVWWMTLLILGLAIAEGITGGLLPWDQLGWWARVVEGNIVGLAPVIGGWLSQMASGGSELGALGLARFYTLHVMVLPIIIGLVLFARHALHPLAPASPATAAANRDHIARNVCIAALVVFVLFAFTGWAHGAPLDAPADPMSDYPARPEWFLMPLFQLRKFFHGSLEFWGTTLVPGAAAGYLVVLPWLDRPGRSRTLVLAPVFVIFVGAGGLSAMAWHHDSRDAHYVKSRAKADLQAKEVAKVAMNGIPPAGALEMERKDPEMRGRDLFDKYCASCHVLGDLGDPEKATATRLDGWGDPEWITAMIHDPDAPEFFGRGPYKEQMPSVDTKPAKKEAAEGWTAMVKTDAERQAVALFLAAQGDEPGDPPRALDASKRALGEKIVSERCTTCHLYKGQGDDEGSNLAPELAGYGSVAWTRAQVANPATVATYREKALDESMKKHMPRFDGDLSPADVEIVARWTRSHARSSPFVSTAR